MNRRRFGDTDLVVSEVGFGCARLGGIFQSATTADVVRLLRRAHDQGITLFDTADMYCQGESEILLGQAFRGIRDQVTIATKAGYCLPARRKFAARLKPLLRPLIRKVGLEGRALPAGARGALSQNFTARYLGQAVEGSLRRLQTDYLDLFQLHSPPTPVLLAGEFVAPLERLKQQGKIRYYGVSCESAEDALVCLRYPGVSSIQVKLNLLDQQAVDVVVPRAYDRGVAVIARECFGGGLLASSRAELAVTQGMADAEEREALRGSLVQFRSVSASHGRSLSGLALQFVLGVDGVSTTLLGMRTDEQLSDNLRHAAAPRLSRDELDALREGTLVH